MSGDPDAALIEERRTASGKRIGVVTLNAPRTLNSLSQAMLDVMAPALARWACDPEVAAVWLQGSGQRAFCAGGDIQALYHAIIDNQSAGKRVNDYAERFFANEYRFDHYLRTYPKPLIVWGEGVVMGGGLGMFAGGDFRIVTANSRLAMPEITIGLFADAGGTAWLGGLPRALAVWLGVTGSQLNARDAIHIDLATHALAVDRSAALEALVAAPLTGTARDDRDVVGRTLDALPGAELPPPNVERLERRIESALAGTGTDPRAVRAALVTLAGDAWLDTGIANLNSGCPTTAGIVLGQIERAPNLSLAGMFQMELVIATHCARNRDFAEGVRALLIDKDRQPRWQYTWDSVTQDWIDAHFDPPWDHNPLAELGS